MSDPDTMGVQLVVVPEAGGCPDGGTGRRTRCAACSGCGPWSLAGNG